MWDRAGIDYRSAELRCPICGGRTFSTGTGTLDLLCLICRAAVLDRIFRARRQQTRRAANEFDARWREAMAS
jgi:hypothetical protein